MDLIQVVPGIPPKVNGIGDYAYKLARRLRDGHGIKTTFLVADSNWQTEEHEEFPTSRIEKRTPESFLDAVDGLSFGATSGPKHMLVQFSPYGYQKRGCPNWLINGLEELHKRGIGALHAAFHELEVHSMRPWSSTFWVPGIQRSLIKRLARISQFRYTNTEEYRGHLEGWGVGRIDLIPNFSAMDEPQEYPLFDGREPNIVIFGRGAQRKWTYDHASGTLGKLCRQLGITRIIDIGQPLSGSPLLEIDGIPIHHCGRLPEEEVNAWMSSSIATFMYYPVPLLTKSSVHAASCATGTIPFIVDENTKELSCPSLITGEDFVAVPKDYSHLKVRNLADISRNAFDNYRGRTSRQAAAHIARNLADCEQKAR